jgi:hypothetical protein
MSLVAMMIDLRYKRTPLLAISVAFYLSATAMAEAAPSGIQPSTITNTPNEMRELAPTPAGSNKLQQASFPRPSEILSSPGSKAQKSRSVAPIAITSKAPNPIDIIVAGITNRPTTPIATKPHSVSTESFTPSARQIKILPAPGDLKIVQPVQPSTQPITTADAAGDRIAATAPFASAPAETKAPIAQPEAAQEISPKSSISKSSTPSNTTPPHKDLAKLDLGGVGQLTDRLVSGSQKLILSIRSDSSTLLSMGSTSLEIPPTLSSRLVLGTTVKPFQNTTLTGPDSGALSIRNIKPAGASAIRLLLTDRRADRKSAIAFSVIGTHGFANKPNV